MIICITGLPGSGKTTLARLLYNKLIKQGYSVSHFTSDQVRSHLFREELYLEGQVDRDFTDEELKRSYAGLYMLIQRIQEKNPEEIIITDGTFRDAASRVWLEVIAQQLDTDFHLIKITAPQKEVKKRLKDRHKETGQETQFDGTYEEPRSNHVVIANDKKDSLDVQIRDLIDSYFLSR